MFIRSKLSDVNPDKLNPEETPMRPSELTSWKLEIAALYFIYHIYH